MSADFVLQTSLRPVGSFADVFWSPATFPEESFFPSDVANLCPLGMSEAREHLLACSFDPPKDLLETSFHLRHVFRSSRTVPQGFEYVSARC